MRERNSVFFGERMYEVEFEHTYISDPEATCDFCRNRIDGLTRSKFIFHGVKDMEMGVSIPPTHIFYGEICEQMRRQCLISGGILGVCVLCPSCEGT